MLGPGLRRLQLDEVDDLEAPTAQEPYPVAVTEVELDRGRVGPLEAVQPERGPEQLAAGRLLLLGAVRIASSPWMRKTSSPPGRSSRAASGIQRYGSAQSDAPYSETARSKLASAKGTASALASSRGNWSPKRRCI